MSCSIAEAEYRVVANDVTKACWLRQLLQELQEPLHHATIVYCDNVSVVYLSINLVQHQRTKHIEINLHFMREWVALGDIRVLYVPTTLKYADIYLRRVFLPHYSWTFVAT